MKKNYKLSAKQIRCYGAYLREQERADSTVQKYLHDLAALLAYLRGRALTKAVLLEWKGDLAGRYAPASVNTMLAAGGGQRLSSLHGMGRTDGPVFEDSEGFVL